MNNLIYLPLSDADFSCVADGTVIVAEPAVFERRTEPDARVLAAEKAAEHSDWRRVWRDGVYHYELLVARQGTREVLDAEGEPRGFTVVGTGRGNW